MNCERKVFLNVAGMLPASLNRRENGKGSEPNRTASGKTGFIDEKQLLAKLPISRRTLGNWKAKGILPFIEIGRRCLYDLDERARRTPTATTGRPVVNNSIGRLSASAGNYQAGNYGLDNRKNKFPVGGVMVTLFMPLVVVIVPS